MTCRSLFALGALLLFGSTTSGAAEDGAVLYTRRCANCHGAKGEGNSATRGPAVKGTKMDANQLVELMTKGQSGLKAPHARGMSRLREADAKAIAQHIKTL
jgi:mono/diheme cytochrome c family protein